MNLVYSSLISVAITHSKVFIRFSSRRPSWTDPPSRGLQGTPRTPGLPGLRDSGTGLPDCRGTLWPAGLPGLPGLLACLACQAWAPRHPWHPLGTIGEGSLGSRGPGLLLSSKRGSGISMGVGAKENDNFLGVNFFYLSSGNKFSHGIDRYIKYGPHILAGLSKWYVSKKHLTRVTAANEHGF